RDDDVVVPDVVTSSASTRTGASAGGGEHRGAGLGLGNRVREHNESLGLGRFVTDDTAVNRDVLKGAVDSLERAIAVGVRQLADRKAREQLAFVGTLFDDRQLMYRQADELFGFGRAERGRGLIRAENAAVHGADELGGVTVVDQRMAH